MSIDQTNREHIFSHSSDPFNRNTCTLLLQLPYRDFKGTCGWNYTISCYRAHISSARRGARVRTGLERRVGLRDIARHGGDERDGVLGGGDGVGGGRVDDEAAGLGGGLEVDVVDADSRPADDAEPAARRLEHLPRDARRAAHHQRVHERHLGAELLRRELVGAVHVRELAQKVQPRGAQLLRDQHRRAPAPCPRRRRRHGPRRRGRRCGGKGGAEVALAGRKGTTGRPRRVRRPGRRRRRREEEAKRRCQGHGLRAVCGNV
jgi:hypothetical protein